MGASGVYVPLFIYPENGTFLELPKNSVDDDDDELLDFYDLVQSRTTLKDAFFKNSK